MTPSVPEQESLPLTEATLFILLSMAHMPRHGYAILGDVLDLSNGRIRLSTGTLYGALGRLLEQGWIERLDSDDPDPGGRSRKEYILTDLGRRILSAEVRRLESLVAQARFRLAEDQS
ncbi:MAG: helix-turn-helix transcriptional regulator [Anaerolineae bacterium]|nr:helix-turn-helix transcriptional regulator [Anaerolineae bacterium]